MDVALGHDVFVCVFRSGGSLFAYTVAGSVDLPCSEDAVPVEVTRCDGGDRESHASLGGYYGHEGTMLVLSTLMTIVELC